MLVLSRKIGQEIVISEAQIRVVVVQINGNRVRLGIQAPAELSVHRREVWEKNVARAGHLGGGDSQNSAAQP